MDFDKEYYDNIVAWIQQQTEGVYPLSELIEDMSTKNKFILHVKTYIECRGIDQLEVTFNTAFSSIRINEYFASIVASHEAAERIQERHRQQNVDKILAEEKAAKTRPMFHSVPVASTTINQSSKRPKGL